MDTGLQAVRLQHVHKRFGSSVVFDDFNLAIEPGEFLVLLGPSGCGKSTLLNIVAGVESHDAGQVFIGGRDVTRLEPGERNVAMVFQSFALYPTMTASANISFALRMHGVPAAEIARRVAQVAATLQIERLLDRKPAQLSGGQQQRVALGRALVRNPAVLLLDEPLSNLDAKLRSDLRVELKRLYASSRRTTLYVTHDQLEALSLASRVVVLHQGKIQQCDTPETIYHRPANRLVAALVGTPTMNFIEGRLDLSGAAAAIHTQSGARIPLPGLSLASSFENLKPVVLGVRAEHIQIVTSDTASITGRVLVEELAGADTFLLTDVGGSELTVRAPSSSCGRRTNPLPLKIDGAAVSLFCPTHGVRLN